MLLFSLFLCISFLIKSTVSVLNKRQAVASRSCGNEDNTISICTPTSSSVWQNGTDQEITWKWNNPTLISYDTLDLYLLYQPTDGNYKTIKSWTGLERMKGVLVEHIDDSWFPSSPLKEENVTWTMYFYIVGSEYDIQQDLSLIPSQHNFFPVPQVFTIIQPSSTAAITTITPTTSSNPINSLSPTINQHKSSSSLPGWAIAVICIAAVILFITVAIAFVWALRRRRNKQNNIMASQPSSDEKRPVLASSKNESHILSAPAPYKEDADSEKSPRPPLGVLGEGHHSSSILSSTDALMIADTFRQFMRRPDWNEENELHKQGANDKKGRSTGEINPGTSSLDTSL
ncbi:MAG: hypothetical protein EXX96DRAFT_562309 [Benjaminiella poitrasii]|nr:MAG: hypothetical protein EXX96DRAFT_562309 [Benjaminiella poitrasii]